MKLETTYENNNYPVIVEQGGIEYLHSCDNDYDKVLFI
ncbi:3-dehydroquinate synthase, partial [Staphylococcus warneri]